jgi:hypothetical protein
MLYKLLIRPILTYAAPVWSNTSNTNYRHLQTLQSKCLRVTGNYTRRTPIPLLHFTLNIEPLYEFIYRLSEKIFHQCSIHQNLLVRQIGDYTIVDLQHRYKKYIHKRTKHLLQHNSKKNNHKNKETRKITHTKNRFTFYCNYTQWLQCFLFIVL